VTSLLMTGGGGAGTEWLFDHWSKRYEVHVADADVDAISPKVPQNRRHSIPYAHEPGFVDAVAALCNETGMDILIPAVDEELFALSDIAKRSAGLRIFAPDAGFITLMTDKLESARAIAARGLPSPQTTTLAEAEPVGYPCIAKPRSGRGSRDVRIVRSRKELDAYIALADVPPDRLIAQELLKGQEYSVMVSADTSGTLRAVVPVRIAIKRGITIRAATCADPNVIEACRNLHEVIPTRATYNVQCMLTDDGRVMPFEINPRISTTLCLAIAAGIDPIDIFLGAPAAPGPLPAFREGLRLQRFWHNQID
jgi:carbamoyl-phosphate synthase large subunit